MSFDKDSTFARVIEDHLELKRKNTDLEREMPISGYHVDDPFQNHPLFKTEEQARIEDTLSGVEPELDPEKVLAWPTGTTATQSRRIRRTRCGAARATSTGATSPSSL